MYKQKIYSASLLVLSLLSLSFLVQKFLPIRPARAATTYTVCASGCDFNTISAALTAAVNGDTILVGATYDLSGEAASLSSNKSLTLDCQNSGAIIGNNGGGQKFVALGATTTIQNCTFNNVRMFANNSIIIQNNTFTTTTASSFHINSAHFYTITGNTGINDIYFNTQSQTGTISNNTFTFYASGFTAGYPILFGSSNNDITITSNTFQNYYSSFTNAITAIGNNLVISSNTFQFPVTSTQSGSQHSLVDISGQNITVAGNKMVFPDKDAGTRFIGVYISPTNANVDTSVTVQNNTMKIPVGLNGGSGGPNGVWAASNATRSVTVTTSYNIIASTSTNPTSIGITLSKGAAALTLVNDYNDLFNLTTNLSLAGGATGSLGANTRTSDPYFKTKDALTTNDLDLAPFSSLLNVNGTYIGADPGPRRSTIYIDPNGTIDYNSVDATSTADAIANLLSADTLQLAAGSYSSITIASTTLATSSITITGTGASTIISGSGSANALSIVGLDSCSVSSVLVQNAGTAFAGVAITSSTSCTVNAVTSTGNGYGFWYRGNSSGNSVSNSYTSSSASYDIYSSATAGNLLQNSSFHIASTTVLGTGSITSTFKARVYVQNVSASPVSGATAALTDHNSAATNNVTTDASGYSPYSGYLVAAVFTSSTPSFTDGGYNPYTVSVAAFSSYNAYSAPTSLTAPNTTVSIQLTSAQSGGSSGGSSPPLLGDSSPTTTTLDIISTTTIRTPTSTISTSTNPIEPATTTPPITPEICGNGLDDDHNNLIDCADSACSLVCAPPQKQIDPTSTEKVIDKQNKDKVTTSKETGGSNLTTPSSTVPEIPTTTEIVVLPTTTVESTTDTRVPSSTIAYPTDPLTRFLGFLSKNASKARAYTQSPNVQKAAHTISPTVVAATALGAAAFITWADIIPLLRYLFLQPALLLGQRKRKGWGQVYNSLSKMPVDLATVRLIDAATNRIVGTRVTDGHGRYAFIAQPGTYRLQVVKNALNFPSTLLSGFTEDGRRTDIYHGEPITVNEKDAVITANIPLDPVGEQKRPLRLRTQRILRVTQTIFSGFGFAATILSTIISPRWFMFALLALHTLLIIIFKRLAIPPKVKSWGIVYDKSNRSPIERTIVRLYNTQFNKLVDTQITDPRGRYYFMAADNRYFVTYEHPAYASEHTDTLDLTHSEDDTIAVDVGLAKKDTGLTVLTAPRDA